MELRPRPIKLEFWCVRTGRFLRYHEDVSAGPVDVAEAAAPTSALAAAAAKPTPRTRVRSVEPGKSRAGTRIGRSKSLDERSFASRNNRPSQSRSIKRKSKPVDGDTGVVVVTQEADQDKTIGACSQDEQRDLNLNSLANSVDVLTKRLGDLLT